MTPATLTDLERAVLVAARIYVHETTRPDSGMLATADTRMDLIEAQRLLGMAERGNLSGARKRLEATAELQRTADACGVGALLVWRHLPGSADTHVEKHGCRTDAVRARLRVLRQHPDAIAVVSRTAP